ncbi:acyltransferase family protein [Bacteroides sp. 224]|uniref:acyltransferase family protein n=1 Tax=Bacteroides sp. 224 TaxID=2302936 RepID=UPI0013D51033|nr:acyltransferase family protein [Bacteroides sp. 224]NDV64462.1 hypothetical protein [Bacteroides sp. 224]
MNNNLKEQRNRTFDILKGITIIFVIIGHANPPISLSSFIYSFHLPLFFIISGYFYNKEKYSNIFFLIKKKIKSCIIPALITTIMIFLLWLIFMCPSPFKDTPTIHILEVLLENSKTFLWGNGINCNGITAVGPAWFLYCLFCGLIILNLVLRIKILFIQICVILFLAHLKYIFPNIPVLPWSLDVSFWAVYYLFVGYCINHFDFLSILNMKLGLVLILLFLANPLYTFVSLNNRDIENILLSAIPAISFLCCFCYINKVAPKIFNNKIGDILVLFGKESIIILCFHLLWKDWLFPLSFIKYNWVILSVYMCFTSYITIIIISNLKFIYKLYHK